MGCGSCSKALTVGITVYDDFRTLAMTVQAARFGAPADCEFLVVDNNPTSPQGKWSAEFCGQAGVRYVALPEPVGTAAAREAVFRHASGRAVLCMDSHVLLAPGALTEFRDFAKNNPNSLDLWHGVMFYDTLNTAQAITHMEPRWGEGSDPMFGVWSSTPDPQGITPTNPPFPIEMHGLGMVGCNRAAWMGNPPGLRGFGGCEGMLHEQFHKAGRRVLCLPFLRWWHLFHRQDQPTAYPNTLNDRCRNYLIWAISLGLPIDEVRRQFCEKEGAKLTPEVFEQHLAEAKAVLTQAESTSQAAGPAKMPSIARQAYNYAAALAKYVAAGLPSVTPEQHEHRMTICRSCEMLVGERCSVCGCPIKDKAVWQTETCPHPSGSRWPNLTPLIAHATPSEHAP